MPYIPNFNKLSLQETAYAPALMRQQHDDAVAKQMELAEAMKFDYLKQDAQGLEPILQKYNTDIEDVSKQIAQNGFSHDLKSKVLGLRSQYIGDDKIRTYKKNYGDAMSQWDEQRKKMIQDSRPGDDINRQKEQFFSGYQGAYSPTGEKNEFTAGRTSGYYDIGEDATKLMTNLGLTEQPIEGKEASIQRVKSPDGSYFYRMTNYKDGSITENKDQLSAIKAYMKSEYGNEKTDRGLFAKISKFDQPYIDSVIDNIAVAKGLYKKNAVQDDVNFGGFNDGQSGSRGKSGYHDYTYSDIEGDSDVTGRTDEEISILDKPIPTDISQSEKAKIAEGASRGGAIPNAQYIKSLHAKKLQENQQELAKQKQKIIDYYKGIYKEYFVDTDPIAATKKAIAAERNNNVVRKSRTAVDVDKKELGGVGSTQKVLSRIKKDFLDPENNNYVILKQDKNTGLFSKNGYKSPQDFIKTVEKNTGWDDQAVEVDNNGDIMLAGENNTLVKINPAALQDRMQKIQQGVLKPILQDSTNPSLFNNENRSVNLPGTNIKYKVVPSPDKIKDGTFDPYNISHRMIKMYVENPNTGEEVHSQTISTQDFKSELVRGMFLDITPTGLD